MTTSLWDAADLDPGTAVIRQIRMNGIDLLCEEDPAVQRRLEPDLWHSAFVMAPWVSRSTADAGAPAPVLSDARGPRTALSRWHGFVRHGGWSTERQGLCYRSAADAFGPGGWDLTLRADSTEDRFDVSLTVRAGEQPATLTVGWHPWFRRQIGGSVATLAFGPMARALSPEPASTWTAVPDGPLDHYVSSPEEIVLTWPGVGTLSVCASSGEYLVFDAEPHGICIEPLLTAAGRPTRIPAGQSEELRVRLRFTAAPDL